MDKENKEQETGLIAEAQKQLIQSHELIEKLTKALAEKTQKTAELEEFKGVIIGTDETVDMAETAKILNYPKIGRNILFSILRDMKVLRENNEPYQAYVDRGYFKVVEVLKTDSYGKTRTIPKTVVYQKGLEWIWKLLQERE